MKRIALTWASLAVVAICVAQPEAVWLNPEHNFGAFNEDLGTVTCVMKAVNTGNEPLVILDARANCGCTTPHYSSEPIAPGDTATILVGYNAIGRPGKFSKKIVVATNATPTRATLTISGTVIGTSNTLKGRYPYSAGAIRLRDDKIAFGEVTDISVSSKYIECYNASADTIHPAVSYNGKRISSTVKPSAVPPGEPFIVSAIFDGAKADDWDIVCDSLSLGCAGDSITINTVAIVNEHFRRDARTGTINVYPAVIDFGRINHGDDKPLTATIEIHNAGDNTLKLRKIASSDPAITVKVKSMTIKAGKTAKATVTVDREKLIGRDMLNSRLTIIANDRANPRTTVRITAEISNQP